MEERTVQHMAFEGNEEREDSEDSEDEDDEEDREDKLEEEEEVLKSFNVTPDSPNVKTMSGCFNFEEAPK